MRSMSSRGQLAVSTTTAWRTTTKGFVVTREHMWALQQVGDTTTHRTNEAHGSHGLGKAGPAASVEAAASNDWKHGLLCQASDNLIKECHLV